MPRRLRDECPWRSNHLQVRGPLPATGSRSTVVRVVAGPTETFMPLDVIMAWLLKRPDRSVPPARQGPQAGEVVVERHGRTRWLRQSRASREKRLSSTAREGSWNASALSKNVKLRATPGRGRKTVDDRAQLQRAPQSDSSIGPLSCAEGRSRPRPGSLCSSDRLTTSKSSASVRR